MPKKTMTRTPRTRTPAEGSPPHCGLCRKTGHLTRTECCGRWICDDEHTYVLFSFARNSCHHNHARYTLCGYHHNEAHPGDWKTCQTYRESFETEMYVWYGAAAVAAARPPGGAAGEARGGAAARGVRRMQRMFTS